MLFAAVHESEGGANRTSTDVRLESALRGKADSICSERGFRLLTHNGRLPGEHLSPDVRFFSLAAPSQSARV